MKQTAVEWYFTELWNAPKDKFIWHSILIKAKAMEKDQIVDAITFCLDAAMTEEEANKEGEQYYNEIYGEDA
jgi:hypothetical protein